MFHVQAGGAPINAMLGNLAAQNAAHGTAVLVGGTVTVSCPWVTATGIIHLTHQVAGGTLGVLSVGTRTVGTSFVINSSSGTDVSTIGWSLLW